MGSNTDLVGSSTLLQVYLFNLQLNACRSVKGGAKVLGPIIKIGSHLTDEEYDRLITPSLVKMFSSSDRTIRVTLLENLPNFVDHLTNKVVNDKIFPNVVGILVC